MTGTAFDDRPTDLASGLSILAAVGALLVVYDAPGQQRAVGVVLLGLVVLAVGRRQWAEGGLLAGGVAVLGAVIVALGFDHALAVPLSTLELAELGPGLFGIAVLGVALWPLRRSWTVTLATAGAGLVLAAVVVTGISHTAGRTALLVATAGTVVAWDAARQAIVLGEQVGRQAGSWFVELSHVGATVLAGGVAVATADAVWRLGITGPSLPGLLVFLGAAVALLVGLYVRPVAPQDPAPRE